MITLILSTFFILSSTQSDSTQCKCNNKPYLEEFITCEKSAFDNGSQIYWQYNCDSSWLTFENKHHHKNIIVVWEEVEFAGRIGPVEWQEYEHTFLIISKQISGCCVPLAFDVYDKNSGLKKDSLGMLIYYSEDKQQPIIAYINGDTITVKNIETQQFIIKALAPNTISNLQEQYSEFYAEFLFEKAMIEKKQLILYLRNESKPIHINIAKIMH